MPIDKRTEAAAGHAPVTPPEPCAAMGFDLGPAGEVPVTTPAEAPHATADDARCETNRSARAEGGAPSGAAGAKRTEATPPRLRAHLEGLASTALSTAVTAHRDFGDRAGGAWSL
jgi:hypothetical protein